MPVSGKANSTPATRRTKESIVPEQDLQRYARRNRIYDDLHPYSDEISFINFLWYIGVLEDFNSFKDMAAPAFLFSKLARSAPVYDGTKMHLSSNDPSGARTYAAFSLKKEAALTSYFKELCCLMADEVEVENKRTHTHTGPQSFPELKFVLGDHQLAPIARSAHKIDLVFHADKGGSLTMQTVHIPVEAKSAEFPDTILKQDFGQIGDYVCTIWKEQLTRTFVPVLFLNGVNLALLVFTRGDWIRVPIGNVCYRYMGSISIEEDDLWDTLLKFWFLVTLPTEKFGHFCNFAKFDGLIRFKHDVPFLGSSSASSASDSTASDSTNPALAQMDMVLATAHIVRIDDQNAVLLKENLRVKRTVSPRSRLVYIYRTKYRGKKAYLKLSWLPLKCMPEGAIYDLLVKENVAHIPEVYDSGIIKKDIFGYRLEYLILEDCGIPVSQFVKGLHESGKTTEEQMQSVRLIVSQTINCLVQARYHNILHRDVSDGNAAVAANGDVKIIDWGYGKVVDTSHPDITITADKWGFEIRTVAEEQTRSDPITGTLLYMSMSVLCGARMRDVHDDIEGIFYVLMHAYSAIYPIFSAKDHPFGFTFHESKALAYTRASIFGVSDQYLENFGISRPPACIQQLLDDMRAFLFTQNGQYIGFQLISKLDQDRHVDWKLAAKIMNEKTVEMFAGDVKQPYSKAKQATDGSEPLAKKQRNH
ncbi:hypothetical protein LPJ66_009859 [Kickxella alabastrina]|uniref:Uncharacterized protein n=1 Tax=Kickxella alabastrina TaxID=61397 RepID=A0ACC1I893_9FUNG|nr:hypothetical protein LPJ66_009859 [Kickxella alabastrina]